MEFSRQEYWSGLPFLSPGDLNPGFQPRSPTLQADSLLSEPPAEEINSILPERTIMAFLEAVYMEVDADSPQDPPP